MSDQPQRPNPPDGINCPLPETLPPDAFSEAGREVVLDGKPQPSDDTPTIISRAQLRPSSPEGRLFSGSLRGRKLAHFELIEPIGVGGMAAVLRARDTQLERFVALKILPPEMAADPENIARFHQEARAAARLDHETIARVFFCGEDQNLHFIAFEFVAGENLRILIDRRGPLPVQEALHYMLQVATGLAHAAERGVVHRDIKPSNIIISPNGRAKLVDMGLARNLGPQTDQGLTQSGVTLGTFDYISPEQALEPRDADVRSDIYSLGCTFYHLLTGRAPVPEGTAARKLHHHQHVPPIDPRQLNPDIPDEVAAILGRMMAKDPRQRYQRPEHLVQHLLQATHRAGGSTGVEGADGVLFVDAALPTPPRSRPLLVAGCCAAIVVVLVVIIGPSHDFRLIGSSSPAEDKGPGDPPPSRPPPGEASVNPGERPKVDPVVPEGEKPIQAEFASWKDLAEFASTMKPDKAYVITLKGDLSPAEDPARDDSAAIVLRGKEITLTGGGSERPTVWTRYVAEDERKWGLVLDSEKVELRNLRLVADANSNTPGQQPAAGVLIRGARDARISDCEFLQGSGPEPSRYSSLAVESWPHAPRVSFERCCFLGGKEVKRPGSGAMGSGGWLDKVNLGGQTAVAVLGAAQVSASNCAFGPHVALFRFDRSPGSSLSLKRCTALAGDEWSLIYLGDDASATLSTADCLFGRLAPAELPAPGGMAMMAERKPGTCLVRLVASATLPKKWYEGTSNRYLNIDAVRLQVNDDANAVEVPFEKQLATLGGTDDRPLSSGTQPLKDRAPLLLLQGSLKPQELLAAFRLDFNSVPALIVPDPGAGGQAVAVVGMKETPWGAPEWKKDDIAAAGAAPGAVKVVDPREKANDSTRGVYKSLEAALAELKTTDVIAIRHTGELPITPVKLLKNGQSLTIRADGDSRPILVLDKDTPDPQAALFRIHGGQLTLEGLDFVLEPKAGFESQAVALLFGDGGVQFKNCVVTLSGRQVPLAAVMLADPKGAMAQSGGAGVPKVSFDQCFIRGDGDLVTARPSRPFELDVNDSLAALTGSLVNIDAGPKETPVQGPEIPVRLNQVTAYLGGHLVRLRAVNLTSLLPVHCTPSKSLLVSAGERKALLHLEAGPKDTKAARDRLLLNGDGNNYANFSPMLDQQPGEAEAATTAVSQETWKNYESEPKFEAVKFSRRLWAEDNDVSPAEVAPKDFVVTTGPRDRGVNSLKLPVPQER